MLAPYHEGLFGTKEPTFFEISAPVGYSAERIIEKRTVGAGIDDKNIFDQKSIPETLFRPTTMMVKSMKDPADTNQIRASRAFYDPMLGYSPGTGNFRNQQKGILSQSDYITNRPVLPIAGFYNPDQVNVLGNLDAGGTYSKPATSSLEAPNKPKEAPNKPDSKPVAPMKPVAKAY